MDQMDAFPPILVVENVSGLISLEEGKNYRSLHNSLVGRGFEVGPALLNADKWLPQSRPRVFVIAVREDTDISELRDSKPGWAHPRSLQKAAKGLENLVWWKLPEPPKKKIELDDIIEYEAPCISGDAARRTLKLIKPEHLRKIMDAVKRGVRVFPGYKRTRNGKQVLELRFDGIAGCLRAPNGGSSRQLLVISDAGELKVRLLSVREAARLMGATEYALPENYNEGYRAMGDAVAVPVVRHLAEHLLKPLAEAVDARS
jgi:DNA (cytosine-5)-methyltransferase 1